jgi:hypothetical protein
MRQSPAFAMWLHSGRLARARDPKVPAGCYVSRLVTRCRPKSQARGQLDFRLVRLGCAYFVCM